MKLSFTRRKDGGNGRIRAPPTSSPRGTVGRPTSTSRKPTSTSVKDGHPTSSRAPGVPSSSDGHGAGPKGSSGSGRGSFSTPDGSTASSKSPGGGLKSFIPAGSLFSGRDQGSGSRADIYGTRHYGSGYPGISTRGVAGRGFPFYFWPLVWGIGHGYHSQSTYLHSREYGDANNSSRPGGPLYTASFQPIPPTNTYTLISDHQTIDSLIDDITSFCPTFLDGPSTPANPYNPNEPSSPQPEEVIQYYRASSVALTLQGYNNSAVFADDEAGGEEEGVQTKDDDPLPDGLDLGFLACLNSTIGGMVPLVSRNVVEVPLVRSPNHGVPRFGQPLGTFNFGVGGLLGLVWICVLLI